MTIHEFFPTRVYTAALQKTGAREFNRRPAVAGRLVLFESWLRHEVAPNPINEERISVSFNYNWF